MIEKERLEDDLGRTRDTSFSGTQEQYLEQIRELHANLNEKEA